MERKVNKYLFTFLTPNVRLKCYLGHLGAPMLCGVSVPNIGVWLPGSPSPPTPSTALQHRNNQLMNTR